MFDEAAINGESNVSSELRSGISAATPAFLEFGGTRRVLAVLPRDGAGALTSAAISEALGPMAATAVGEDNNLALCVEAGELSVPHVAASLVEYRRDRVEFAGRVHSRTDIAWSPLFETAAKGGPIAWGGVEAGNPCRAMHCARRW
jgi:hypothetical protein